MKDETFISRWSRRKAAAAAGTAGPTADAVPAPAGTQSTSPAGPVRPTADVVPAPAGTQSPLPCVESLTPESDFTPFMKPEVDAGVKREALKTLFQDPRFNVMDGLDVYIDDYSKPDPLPDGWLEKLNMVKRLGIFAEPEDNPEGAAAAAPPTVSKPPEEQALAPVPEPASADTPGDGIPPPDVGKSECFRE